MSRIDYGGSRTRTAIEDEMMRSSGRKSNYKKLFGTPERAAETAWLLLMCRITTKCNKCPMRDGCNISTDIDCDDGKAALLEWLRGDA